MQKITARWVLILTIAGSLASIESTKAAATRLCFGRSPTIVGTDEGERLIGTPQPDVILGLGGRDRINGKSGDDFICPGPGGRSIFLHERGVGGPGDDHIGGGRGTDFIVGGGGDDFLRGGLQHDFIRGSDGDDRLEGGEAGDDLWAQAGDDLVLGQAKSDSMRGQAGDDRLFGGGNGESGDLVEYYGATSGVEVNLSKGSAHGHGRDRLGGIEIVFGSNQDDKLLGGDKADALDGMLGDDVLNGRAGNDCLIDDHDSNRIYGGDGFDYFDGERTRSNLKNFDCFRVEPGASLDRGVIVDLGAGTAVGMYGDSLLSGIEGALGTEGKDRLTGNGNDNHLWGGSGDDVIRGQRGDDVLDGARNDDRLNGGAGLDQCLRGEILLMCE